MLALLLDDNAYEIVGLLHLLAVIVAFGPQFAYPALKRAGATATIAQLHMRLTLPALVLVPILGLAMVGLSDDEIEMGETWIVLSLAGWIVIAVVSWFMIRPALADDGPDTRAKLASGVGVTHLLMIVILCLMVFKPGGA